MVGVLHALQQSGIIPKTSLTGINTLIDPRGEYEQPGVRTGSTDIQSRAGEAEEDITHGTLVRHIVGHFRGTGTNADRVVQDVGRLAASAEAGRGAASAFRWALCAHIGVVVQILSRAGGCALIIARCAMSSWNNQLGACGYTAATGTDEVEATSAEDTCGGGGYASGTLGGTGG